LKSLNELLVTMPKRAERKPDDYLVKSFVHVGSVFSLFSCFENQVIYGRRGTGKTHLLKYFKNDVQNQGIITLEIDMRTMGSTGGMYSDSHICLSERASRLLSDLLCDIREQILQSCYDYDECNLSELAPLLDDFVEEATNFTVDGQFESETTKSNSSSSQSSQNSKVTISKQPNFSLDHRSYRNQIDSDSLITKETGKKSLRMHFGSLSRILKRIVNHLPQKSLLILIDEWSEVPLELQPYLADMLRRTVFSIPSITVKIAAITHRSNFRIYTVNNEHIGLEITSDASTSINLDQFMVFDNDSEKSVSFFKNLIFKHVKAADRGNVAPEQIELFISQIFTNIPALEEFARASEGVPRDAIHIIAQATLIQNGQKLGVKSIRNAARQWYTTSKSKDFNSRKEAVQLLEWIVTRVIGHQKTRAFLVQGDIRDNLIDFLFDSRVIHLIKQGVSVNSMQGQKFNLYSLDYGCYAHLINTKNEPKGLLRDDSKYILVPKIDNMYNRSSILDIENYYKVGLLPFVEHTNEIELTKHFLSEEIEVLDFDDEIFKCFPKYLEARKVKNTLYIPLIFAGLIVLRRLGKKWSCGSEITGSINTYIISDKKNYKSSTNISRALRNEPLMSEGWLIIKHETDSPMFCLAENWDNYWLEYFSCQPPKL